MAYSSQPVRTDTSGLIAWTYSGPTDPLVGSGATFDERMIGYGGAALVTALLIWVAYLTGAPITSAWQWAVLAFFAYDIGGGAVANMLNSCKRFYHSPPKPEESSFIHAAKNVRVFTAFHVHPIIAAALLGGSVGNAFIWYGLLQVSVWVVVASPLYLRRPVATLLTVLALIASSSLLPIGMGLEWFIPCLFIKMAIGHAVQEEPYAPSQH